jgi:hypothetical protein
MLILMLFNDSLKSLDMLCSGMFHSYTAASFTSNRYNDLRKNLISEKSALTVCTISFLISLNAFV